MLGGVGALAVLDAPEAKVGQPRHAAARRSTLVGLTSRWMMAHVMPCRRSARMPMRCRSWSTLTLCGRSASRTACRRNQELHDIWVSHLDHQLELRRMRCFCSADIQACETWRPLASTPQHLAHLAERAVTSRCFRPEAFDLGVGTSSSAMICARREPALMKGSGLESSVASTVDFVSAGKKSISTEPHVVDCERAPRPSRSWPAGPAQPTRRNMRRPILTELF